jgi:hypothetical protein
VKKILLLEILYTVSRTTCYYCIYIYFYLFFEFGNSNFISYYCFNFLIKMSVYTHQLILDYNHYHHHRPRHHISQYGNVYFQSHELLKGGMDIFKKKKLKNLNGTYLSVHVQCSIFLTDFNQIWIWKKFHRRSVHQCLQKSFQWEPCWCMGTDRLTGGHGEANGCSAWLFEGAWYLCGETRGQLRKTAAWGRLYVMRLTLDWHLNCTAVAWAIFVQMLEQETWRKAC